MEWKQLEQVEGLSWLAQNATPSDEAPIWCSPPPLPSPSPSPLSLSLTASEAVPLSPPFQLAQRHLSALRAPTRPARPLPRRRYTLDGEGERIGPLTAAELRSRMGSGELTADSAIWSATLGSWQRVGDVPSLAELLGAA